jgi:hypothetical protein
VENLGGEMTSSATKLTSTRFNTVKQTFQSSPLSCEYMMTKTITTKSKVTGKSSAAQPVDTYVKAIFTLAADGCTPVLSSTKEYDPAKITFSTDYSTSYLNGTKVTLPSLFDYEPTKVTSTRVDSTVKNIS